MSRYEAAHVSAGGITSGVCAMEIRTTSSKPVWLRELGITGTTAGGSANAGGTIGIGRPAAIGVTPSGAVTFQAAKSGDAAGVTTMAAAWTTPPTSPTTFLRRFTLAGNTGSGVIWQWGVNELLIPVSSGFVVWLITAPSTVSNPLNVYAVIEE